ncbi:hypothetical protein Tsubulata_015354, partial [Turnera subulata]
MIEKIVRDISDKLFFTSTGDSDGLVGMEGRIEEMESLVCLGSNDVRMVGIWGMGGIGKTTIARVVYDRVCSRFGGKCFLANVKESFSRDGAVGVREKLLSTIFMERNLSPVVLEGGPNVVRERLRHIRAIIVLDDVDKLEQLEILAKSCEWFGPGSRIIITTRDKHLLAAHGVEHVYELKIVERKHALQLFNQFAFKQSPIPEEYSELSKHAIGYAKGLPLALKVLGSFLCSRSKKDWESALKKLESYTIPDIQNVLKISYDGLDDEQKAIFLDIACFFNGESKERVTEFLDGCGYFSEIGITILIDKSLLTSWCGRLEMHDLLQEMGWEIVRQESNRDPGKRSRLWNPNDVHRVLTNPKGTYKVKLPKGLESFGPQLRYLHWHQYPLKSLPPNFCPENLVELNLPHSKIEQLWDGHQDLVNLKQIDLSHCTNLVGNIDLSMAPNLERVLMNGCTSLHEAPACMPRLSKLKLLGLTNCKRLSTLPSTYHLESLTRISLIGCSSLTKFPEISPNIRFLHMSGTAIREVPSSIECLTKLENLEMDKCTRLETLPRGMCKLKSLSTVDLSGCENLASFPEIMETMDHLYSLKLEGTAIKELHPSIENLTGLKYLHLERCKSLERLPTSIWSLQSLEDLFLRDCPRLKRLPLLPTFTNYEYYYSLSMPQMTCPYFSITSLDLDGSNIESLPADIKTLTRLYTLSLNCCKKLKSLPELPLSLISMAAHDCTSLTTVSTSWYCSLVEKWTDADYYFTNCFKLSQNAQRNIVGNFLRRTQHIASVYDDYRLNSFKYHHGYYSHPELFVHIPGSEIPEFFRYRSTGSCFTAHLPPNWYNSKFLGFAMCAVISFNTNHSEENGIDNADGANPSDESPRDIGNFLVRCEFGFNHYSTEAFPSSDHIVMGYDAYLATAIGGDDWLTDNISFKFSIHGGLGPSSLAQ